MIDYIRSHIRLFAVILIRLPVCGVVFWACGMQAKSIYVTGFGKRCTVHTLDFEYLEIYKNHNKWYTELKFLEKIEE